MIRSTHVALAAGLLVAGCAVGPNFMRPAAPSVDGYRPEHPSDPAATADTTAGAAQRFDVGQDIQGEWWTLFHSESLDQLVQRALKANPDIDAAQAALRVKRGRMLYVSARGALFPTASASFQPERERISGASFGAPNVSPTFSLVTAQLSVSHYAPDVFGGTHAGRSKSLRSQAEYQRFELEATYLTLTSNLVVAAITERHRYARQITATEQIIKGRVRPARGGESAVSPASGAASRADLLSQQATVSAIARDLAAIAQAARPAARSAHCAGGRVPQ